MLTHFMWINNPLPYSAYLGIRTAVQIYGKVILWTDGSMKENDYWHEISQYVTVRTVRKDWLEVMNLTKSIGWKMDLLRYRVLSHLGGLFLDTDTISLKSMLPLRGSAEVVLGQSKRTTEGFQSYLNGAIFYVRQRNNPDLQILAEKSFQIVKVSQSGPWGALGPLLLTEYQHQRTTEWTILSHEPYYYYGWKEWEKWFKNRPIKQNMYFIHWWSFAAKGTQDFITPQYIKKSNSLYARAVRQVLKDGLK